MNEKMNSYSINFNNYKCAIFDLDGTLINSTGLWAKVDDDFFAKRNMEIPEGFLEAIKTHTLRSGAQYLVSELHFPESEEDIINEWTDAAKHTYDTEVTLKDGVKEFLDMLKNTYGYKIGIATSNSSGMYEQCLKNNDIYGYFDTFTHADEVTRRKGYPDIYQLAARRMGADVKECIVFEDIIHAVRGSKMGGFLTVAVEDEGSFEDRESLKKEADVYITSYKELI